MSVNIILSITVTLPAKFEPVIPLGSKIKHELDAFGGAIVTPFRLYVSFVIPINVIQGDVS